MDGDEPHGLVDPFGARISQTKNRSAPRRRRDTARRSRRGDRLTTTIDHETMDAGEDGRKCLELASRKEERRIETAARDDLSTDSVKSCGSFIKYMQRVFRTLRTNLVYAKISL